MYIEGDSRLSDEVYFSDLEYPEIFNPDVPVTHIKSPEFYSLESRKPEAPTEKVRMEWQEDWETLHPVDWIGQF